MSQENVEIVRRFLEPANGHDLVPAIEEMVELFGSPAPLAGGCRLPELLSERVRGLPGRVEADDELLVIGRSGLEPKANSGSSAPTHRSSSPPITHWQTG